MMKPRLLLAALVASLVLAAQVWATGEEAIKPGTRLEELPVGPKVYRDVVVRSLSARTLTITHAGGMVSIHLRDLTPEWQTRLHYDPAAESFVEPPVPAVTPVKLKPKASNQGLSEIERVLKQFGQPATIQAEVNLRPKFIELGLGVRNQGRRPSCSIYAIVSALEYQNARLGGVAQNFSEDYLIWATEKTVQRTAEKASSESATPDEDADAGFTLTEVVNALRTYGIPLQSELPNDHTVGMRGIPTPPPNVIKEASEHQRVFVHQIPGRDAATRVNNLVHALNAGMPVAVGLAWPNYRSLRTGYLSGQKPMENARHAVTLVGYQSKTGRIEDAYFVFKNSWGENWGQNGYGTVTYAYLSSYISDAVILEVQRG